MDWLGEIGGVTELLTRFVTFILGGYLAFNQLIAIQHEVYHIAHENDNEINSKKQ